MRITISDSSHGEEILRMMDELSALPGFEIYEELMALNTSIYVLDKNFAELESFVADLTQNPKWDHLFQVENRHVLHRVSEDIVRRLHNFSASVLSLVDHTRRLYGKYYEEEQLMPNYEEEIRLRFAENPEAQFVQKLRHYCQHYASPLLSFQSSYDQADDRATRIAVLRKDELLRFGGWGTHAREYLDQSPDLIDFLAAIRRYHSAVLEFYTSFQQNQEEVHQQDLEEFKEKEGELLRLQLIDKLERCLVSDDQRLRSEAYLYHHVFAKSDLQELSAIEEAASPRINKAVELLEKRFEVNQEMQAKLLEAYSLDGFSYFDQSEAED